MGNLNGFQLTQKELNNLKEQAKRETSFSFVPFVLKQSDHYPAAHFRLALLFVFASSLIMYYIPWEWTDPIWYLWAQVPAVFFGYIMAYRPFLKRLFTTSSEIDEEVHQKALELFHNTQVQQGKCDGLILVSILEKRVEIVLGHELASELPPPLVQQQVKKIARSIKKIGLYAALSSGLNEFKEFISTHKKETVKVLSIEEETAQVQEIKQNANVSNDTNDAYSESGEELRSNTSRLQERESDAPKKDS